MLNRSLLVFSCPSLFQCCDRVLLPSSCRIERNGAVKKNVLFVSVIAVCVAVLMLIAINAFASSGGNLENCVGSGSCTGGSGGCSVENCTPAERASCGVGSSSGCTTRSGGCGSSAPSNIDFGQLETDAIAYYSEQTGETDISAKAYNGKSGLEVAIIKNDKVIDILTIGK